MARVWSMLGGWSVVLVLVSARSALAQTATPAINAENADVVNAYFTASNVAPLLGELFTLTLTVEVPAGVSLPAFPVLPEDMGALMILEQDAITSQTLNDGTTIFEQTMRAVLWEPGFYITPELSVAVTVNGATFNNLIKSASWTVPALVELSGDLTLRPALPPRDVAYTPPYVIVLVIVVLASGIFGLRWLLWQGRSTQIRQGTPAQVAIAELEDLKMQQLQAALLYPMIADKLRQYLQVRFNIRAVEMTTAELMETLQRQTSLPDALRKTLRQLLEQADLVKFARFEPDANAPARLVNFGIQWIREVDTLTLQDMPAHD